MKFNKKLSFILVLALSSISYAAGATAKKQKALSQKPMPSSYMGVLSNVKGEVSINGKAAKSGDKININQNLQTGENGVARILLSEGMAAVVDSNSEVLLEKYDYSKSKLKGSQEEIISEKAQLGLQKGSLRMLVGQQKNTIRIATVYAGDAFGIVQAGEAHFLCDEKCVQKMDAIKKANADLENLIKTKNKK